jgi:hypothetical protein
MKYFFSILATLLIFSCSKEKDETSDEFECTVDYIEFINTTSAIVKFDTTNEGETRSFYGRYNYEGEGGSFVLGDQMVIIKDFKQDGNNATFVFEYGENLGFFCANIFETLPGHSHDNFSAEAVKENSGRNVGRWKIKKKTAINSTQN